MIVIYIVVACRVFLENCRKQLFVTFFTEFFIGLVPGLCIRRFEAVQRGCFGDAGTHFRDEVCRSRKVPPL